jgi:signal transduction histidine kinase
MAMRRTYWVWFREPSLAGTFALASFLIIALIAAGEVTVLWLLLREDVLDRERTNVADAIRAEAHAALQPEDFTDWESREARERFERFFRRALLNSEIVRVKLYNADMRVVWSDESRLLGARFPDNRPLAQALRGDTVAHLEHVEKSENVYERNFSNLIELYVPVTFAARGPGTATITGVVEVYKDASRVLANLARGRLTVGATALGGAAILYVALFGIVSRASRRLRAQQQDLDRQAAQLEAANRELGAMQAQLRVNERLAAIGEVSAAVAHGIRNPLANIRASAQVALDVLEDESTAQKHLGAITAEVDRLDRWLRELLNVVRPFEPRLVPVRLNGLVEDLLRILSDRSASGGVRVERALDSELPVLIADEVQLQQALLGVLENALDALPAGGTLGVRTEWVLLHDSPAVRVTIRDDGEGIPADRLARIFEAFYTTKSRGTGLGLAITRKVVEGHGGRVDIESHPGAGTTVSITLPVQDSTNERT